MSTPEERIRIWRERQEAAERKRTWAQQQAAQQQPPGFWENVKIGAQRAILSASDAGRVINEAVSAAAGGNFEPLKQLAETVSRGAAPYAAALGSTIGGGPTGAASFLTERAAQAAPTAELTRQREERIARIPELYSSEVVDAETRARLAERAGLDPSVFGKLTRGGSELLTGAIPAVAAGIATGGSIPAIATVAGLQSLGQPESLIPTVALAATPIPVGKAVAPILRRIVGGSAARAVEQEVALGGQQFLPGMEGMLEANIAKATARSPWQDSVLAYYRANLLTNPAGRAADLGSTVINQFADAAARPIAAAVDTIVGKLTGSRAITGPSLTGTARAFGSIKQGLREAGEVLKTGRQAIESGAADAVYSGEIRSGLGKVVDVPVNGIFRMLGALDAPFRRFGFARNLYDRAKVAALNEAKSGKIPWEQKTERIRELLDDPDIIRAAVRDGEAAVLSEPNRISSWLASQTHNSANARLAVGIVQPFMRIPLNAVLRAADFSGVGGIKALFKIARGVGRKARGQSFFRDLEDQRVFAQNVAAGSFAPAGFMLGIELEQRGRMEGFYYTSKRDFPNGKVPTSINVGGQNYDINRLGGYIAAPLFLGATYSRLRKQDAGQANALLRSFSALVQTAPALGYFGVPAKAGRLLTTDEPGNALLQEAGSTAAGFVPASGAMRFTAKALDPINKRLEQGFTGPILGGIPGLRQRLAEKPSRQQKRRR